MWDDLSWWFRGVFGEVTVVDNLILFLLSKAIGRLGPMSMAPLVSSLILEVSPPAFEGSFTDVDDSRTV